MIFSEMHPILGAIVTGAFVYFIGILIALYRYLLGGKGLKYEGKHAFITGGSTGLGLSLATMLYAKGAKVTIVARTEAKLKKAAETISKEGKDQVQYFCFDLSNPDVNKVEELFTQAEDKFGDVEYLFCNAGSSLPTMFLEADLDYYESQMKTNYLNYVKTSQTMAKRMAQRRSGTIVYVSSILGALTCVGYSAYSPSKHAIKALADVVRIELAPYNVNVHLFLPGSILTPGYYEENKMKPEVSKRVEGTADFLEPDK